MLSNLMCASINRNTVISMLVAWAKVTWHCISIGNAYMYVYTCNAIDSWVQVVSGIYTSPFLDTDDLKLALRVRKVSGAFEKRAPGLADS